VPLSRPTDEKLQRFAWTYDINSVIPLFKSAKKQLDELGFSFKNAQPYETTTELLGGFNGASWRSWIESVDSSDTDALNALCRFAATCGRRLGEIATRGDDPLQDIVDTPQEKLDVELKPWLDPTEKAHIAKFAKALIALRNNNGGFLVLGFEDDGTSSPNPPSDLDSVYHIDTIQQIVSKYAFEPFAVDIEIRIASGQPHPIVVVPKGVLTPVFAKSTIADPDNEKKNLVQDDMIYVRSITANNRVSSSKLRRGDINRLMRICFENREADIGAFIRRHLTGLNVEGIQSLVTGWQQSTNESSATTDYLESSFSRYQEAYAERGTPAPEIGYMEFAAVIDGIAEPKPVTQEFLYTLKTVQRDYSGWPPWTFIDNPEASVYNPRVVAGVWEALMDGQNDGAMAMLDYWRIDPTGRLYYLRALEDDVRAATQGIVPGTVLDFHLAILRVTEVLVNAIRFSRVFASEAESTIQGVFRWRGLKDRALTSWTETGRILRRQAKAYDGIVTSEFQVSSNLADSAIPSHVYQIVRPLFLAFDGYDLPRDVLEEIASKLIAGR
jgi:hypothetical protein